MIDSSKLREIIESEDTSFSFLALIAGGDPRTFYRGANFDGIDLRDEDLRGFDLTSATFKDVRINRNTKVDKPFSSVRGLRRERIEVPAIDAVISLFSQVGIEIERPTDRHIGDVIDEIVFGGKFDLYLKSAIALPLSFDQFNKNRIIVMNEQNYTESIGPSGRDALVIHVTKALSKKESKLFSILNNFDATGSASALAETFIYGTKRPKSYASVSTKIKTILSGVGKRERVNPSQLCSILLLSFGLFELERHSGGS